MKPKIDTEPSTETEPAVRTPPGAPPGSRGRNLTEGPVGATLLRLTGPMVLGLASVMLFNIVDTIWVGRLGADALAAMTFTFPVAFFVMSITMGLGIGLTSAVSRAIGRGDGERVRRLTTDGLFLANVVVVSVALGGLFTMDPLFRAMGASADQIAMVRQYMVPWYLGVGLLVLPMVGNSAIRATGDTKTPSMIMAVAGLVNLVLDPFLIFGLGPFPRLELRGAAVATVISWALTFAAALWVLARRDRMLTAHRPAPAEVLASWRQILHVGMPAAGTYLLLPLAAGALTRLVASRGTEALAAYGVGSRVEALAMIGLSALGVSLTPFAGQNFGADRTDRVRIGLRFSTRLGLGYGVGAAILLALFAVPVARLFNDHPEVIANATLYFYLLPWSYGPMGMVFVANAIFNGAGKPLRSAFLIFLRLFVLTLPLAYFGAYLVPGVRGIFLGIALGNLVAGIVAVFLTRHFVGRVEEGVGRLPADGAQSSD